MFKLILAFPASDSNKELLDNLINKFKEISDFRAKSKNPKREFSIFLIHQGPLSLQQQIMRRNPFSLKDKLPKMYKVYNDKVLKNKVHVFVEKYYFMELLITPGTNENYLIIGVINGENLERTGKTMPISLNELTKKAREVETLAR